MLFGLKSKQDLNGSIVELVRPAEPAGEGQAQQDPGSVRWVVSAIGSVQQGTMSVAARNLQRVKHKAGPGRA
jgi:hypothetical protein